MAQPHELLEVWTAWAARVTILLFLHLLLDAAGTQPIRTHLSKPLDVGQAVIENAACRLAAS
ncbi:unnamed protein product [Gulo gulo]|uniref:Uncharacterized protein n=1 Tax=Gulo gulo TaxID=48420 RepID=A0A9X9Q4F9_GULGU|nr:unnamed protein product [Gulo gulo]